MIANNSLQIKVASTIVIKYANVIGPEPNDTEVLSVLVFPINHGLMFTDIYSWNQIQRDIVESFSNTRSLHLYT